MDSERIRALVNERIKKRLRSLITVSVISSVFGVAGGFALNFNGFEGDSFTMGFLAASMIQGIVLATMLNTLE